MIKITPVDDNGDVVDALFQWDKGINLNLTHDLIAQAYNVHFANTQSTSAYVVESSYSDGILTATIPDILLRASYPILGYVYIEDDSGLGRATLYFKIQVEARAQPADYTYSDSSEYILIEDALEQIAALLAAAEEAAEEAENSSTSAATSAEEAATSAEKAATSAEEVAEAADTAVTDALSKLGFGIDDEGYIYQEDDEDE